MSVGNILVHRTSGSFAELIESNRGYSLKLFVRDGIFMSESITKPYPLDEVMESWRQPSANELESYYRYRLNL